MKLWKQSITSYQKEIELKNPEGMVDLMQYFLEQQTAAVPSVTVQESPVFEAARA
ncbi:hypothetical protein RCG23_15050 [Neobacillus sp. PS3-34]|uniref:hypothetical protein n=1 Tax=Neobacillus sp. PS3-34 TaxID=3070678 RepID=UPI0027E02407|nr:hypothetical protein [Neobacillus sp. PS3-34]WML46941.1 hypothetical protein RCG23_15050 [Neobacillus sp. PS3-34]